MKCPKEARKKKAVLSAQVCRQTVSGNIPSKFLAHFSQHPFLLLFTVAQVLQTCLLVVEQPLPQRLRWEIVLQGQNASYQTFLCPAFTDVPGCSNPVHAICGVENTDTNRKLVHHDTICFLCADNNDIKKKASEQHHEEQQAGESAEESVVPARKPKAAPVKDDLKELYSHFEKLDHKFCGLNGKKQNHCACVCVYCKQADEKFGPGFLRKKFAVELAMYRRNLQSHLKKCPHFAAAVKKQKPAAAAKRTVSSVVSAASATFLESPKKMARAAASTVAGAANAASKRFGQAHMFGLPVLKRQEVEKSETLLIEFVVDNAIPFNVVNSGSFARFIDSVRPGAAKQMPKKDKLRTKLLKKAAEEATSSQESHIAAAISRGHRAGMVTDTWMNVRKIHIEGVILTLGVVTFLIKSLEAAFVHHALAVARGWETLLFQTFTHKFHYFASDDAGQCGRARRILALRYPFILFICCWAHQINLMVKALLQCPKFKDVAKKAIAAASAIIKSSSKWLGRLRDMCEAMYGKRAPVTVATVGETRWNSTQSCFASQLQIQSACRTFVTRYEGELPAELEVWGSADFWFKLTEAELLIRPLCDASHLMQWSKNTLAHVMLVLLNIAIHIIEYCGNDEDATVLLSDIERRWKRQEQHLFFLAFALHPLYRNTAVELLKASNQKHGNWGTNANPFSVSRLTQAALFYYQKFELDQGEGNHATNLQRFKKHIKLWLQEGEFVDIYYYEGGDVVEHWIGQRDEQLELANLAAFLLDAPVEAAACE